MNENDKESYLRMLGYNAQHMDWKSFSNSVSQDVNSVRIKVDEYKKETKQEIHSLHKEVRYSSTVSSLILASLILPVCKTLIDRWLNNRKNDSEKP